MPSALQASDCHPAECGVAALHLERWPEAETAVTDEPETTIQLPEIGSLEIRDFRVTAAAEDDQPYRLQGLKIESFAPNRSSPFRLEVEGFGTWVGSLFWSPEQTVLEVTADGAGFWSGVITLRVVAHLTAASGAVAVDWTGEQADAQPGGVDLGLEARDHARLPQQSRAHQAGRRCQPHLLRQFLVGNPSIVPQKADDFVINSIECVHNGILPNFIWP